MIWLSCKEVSFAYGSTLAVEHVSFDIKAGEYLCILGENGSGKSTLVKGLLGLQPLKSGTISLENGLKRDEIGYLPQQTTVQNHFPANVSEIVLSGCLNKKTLIPFYNKHDRERANTNMKKLGIESIKKTSFNELSGGQKQRVLLARALCATEKILFLDEPVSGLDPVITSGLYEITRKLSREEGISIVMVSHDINAALQYADSILHMETKAVFFGTKEEYQHSEYSRRFLRGDCKC